MEYLELNIEVQPKQPWTEIAMVQLADNGFESFVETENGLLAYGQVTEVNCDLPLSGTILADKNENFALKWSVKRIPQQNWNALWEADFHPVEVENYLTILAPFHSKEACKGMCVEILPKMSFGTGHHQTTWMMAKAMFELPKMAHSVLDMGTGTGVLAIVAEKLNAEKILAVDIEDWSVENTLENAARNTCTKIEAICGDIDSIPPQQFGLILANINKNVLKIHLPHYAQLMENGGTLLLSGFFDSDVPELVSAAESNGFLKKRILNKDNWAAIELLKQE